MTEPDSRLARDPTPTECRDNATGAFADCLFSCSTLVNDICDFLGFDDKADCRGQCYAEFRIEYGICKLVDRCPHPFRCRHYHPIQVNIPGVRTKESVRQVRRKILGTLVAGGILSASLFAFWRYRAEL